LISYLFFGGS